MSKSSIDILLVDTRSIDKIKKMIIIEVKSYSTKEVPQGATMGAGYTFRQMEEGWLKKVRDKYLLKDVGTELYKSGKLLEKALQDSGVAIEKFAAEVDFKGAVRMIKLN
jgi:hypothetical protein